MTELEFQLIDKKWSKPLLSTDGTYVIGAIKTKNNTITFIDFKYDQEVPINVLSKVKRILKDWDILTSKNTRLKKVGVDLKLEIKALTESHEQLETKIKEQGRLLIDQPIAKELSTERLFYEKSKNLSFHLQVANSKKEISRMANDIKKLKHKIKFLTPTNVKLDKLELKHEELRQRVVKIHFTPPFQPTQPDGATGVSLDGQARLRFENKTIDLKIKPHGQLGVRDVALSGWVKIPNKWNKKYVSFEMEIVSINYELEKRYENEWPSKFSWETRFKNEFTLNKILTQQLGNIKFDTNQHTEDKINELMASNKLLVEEVKRLKGVRWPWGGMSIFGNPQKK